MRLMSAAVAMMLVLAAVDTHAQRRSQTGPVTFAIMVTDPTGAPMGNVIVTVEGPAKRRVTTEAGRIALENLPVGTYHFTFECEGFYVSEKDVTARGRAPIDVKVTMTPRPKPVPQLRTLPPPAPAWAGNPVVLDLPAFIEKNYVGRAAGKVLPLACSQGGTATLIQMNQPITEHAHPDADEFIYVIAGAGTARIGGRDQPLSAGVFLLVPRRAPHAFVVTGKSPLVMLSQRAGEKCGGL